VLDEHTQCYQIPATPLNFLLLLAEVVGSRISVEIADKVSLCYFCYVHDEKKQVEIY